ncbi:MAG TPA: Asp-tRNA(Asn)/Glu-tRNA(Gln) amidotransferase subunit GatB [Saprospiraceae bacterium]|nr:Asp-tRNA(Asn)/Glu-tRNA(Gln) amidotransferase subunit GatB [Saprospiraceae bacterium]
MSDQKYEAVIGLEVHIQLATKSKAFCSDDTTFGRAPNTQVGVVSLGHPGVLPKVNSEQIAHAVRLGQALGCRINLRNTFDRKNYFYADLPKGYQITQDQSPICIGGALPIKLGEEWRSIDIHHIHMEEDAGKSIHTLDPKKSMIDLNRAGVPLLELVTEPDLRSAEEVDAFMSGMRQLVRYLGVSDGNMEQGSMRCDINVSIRPRGAEYLMDRCEVKNVNSMRYARQAIAYEFKRQQQIVEGGGTVRQQTLNFDPATGRTSPLREKEDAHDYRYFPEPDLPPIVLSEAYIAASAKKLPYLPWQLHELFRKEYDLPDYDATLLTADAPVAAAFIALCKKTKNFKAASNLMINKLIPHCQENNLAIADFPVSFRQLAAFISLIDEDKVSNTTAYQRLFPALVEQPGQDPADLAEQMNLVQSSDSDFLEGIAKQVLADFPGKVSAYQNGKKGLLGFFMGQLMKRSKGKADPKAANKLLQELLDAS